MNTIDKNTRLFYEYYFDNDYDKARILIDKKQQDINKKDTKNRTILEKLIMSVSYYAYECNEYGDHSENNPDIKKRLTMCEWLIENGADIECIDNNNSSLLMRSISNKVSTHCIRFLIRNGVNINLVDNNVTTALMYLSNQISTDHTQHFIFMMGIELIKCGINIYARNNEEKTAKDICKEWNHCQALYSRLKQAENDESSYSILK